jgi:hypothetical protein
MTRVRKTLERGIGYERVLHVSDFIDRGTFLGHKIGDIELIVAFLDASDTTTVSSLPDEVRAPGFEVIEVDLADKGVEESREALWHAVVAGVFAARAV